MGGDPDPAARIQRLRTRLGLSQEQLARQLGASFATVSRWESGRTQMSARASRALTEFEARAAAEGPRTAVIRTWPAPGAGPVQSEVLEKSAFGAGPQVREELKSFTK